MYPLYDLFWVRIIFPNQYFSLLNWRPTFTPTTMVNVYIPFGINLIPAIPPLYSHPSPLFHYSNLNWGLDTKDTLYVFFRIILYMKPREHSTNSRGGRVGTGVVFPNSESLLQGQNYVQCVNSIFDFRINKRKSSTVLRVYSFTRT